MGRLGGKEALLSPNRKNIYEGVAQRKGKGRRTALVVFYLGGGDGKRKGGVRPQAKSVASSRKG